MTALLKAIAVAGILLILLAVILLGFMEIRSRRRDAREQRKAEREHEERMELFDDEDL